MALPLLGRLIIGRTLVGDDQSQLDQQLVRTTAVQLRQALNAPIKISGIMYTSPSLHAKLEGASTKKVKAIMKFAKKKVKPLTPKDTGKARSGWKLAGSGKNTTLINSVPYVRYLEKCDHSWHSHRRAHSAQAPDGMLNDLMNQIHRKFK